MKKKLSIIIYTIFFCLCSILAVSCNNNNNDNNNNNNFPDYSYISVFSNGNTNYISLPYSTLNMRSLSKSDDSNYIIYPDADNSYFTVTVLKNEINGIYFGSDWSELYSVPVNFCRRLFYKSSFSIVRCNLPKYISILNDNFCQEMFANSNISIIQDFNLPKVTSIKNNFCQGIFENCSNISTLPFNFFIPDTSSVTNIGDNFFYKAFSNTKLISIPYAFSLPQDFTANGINFCQEMFNNTPLNIDGYNQYCDFKISTNKSGKDNFCYQMFKNSITYSSINVNGTPTPDSLIPLLRN